MSQTIKKSIGEGFGKGELYAALAYDVTDRFGGMKIKALMLNSTGRISFLDANAYIYSSTSTQLDLVATTIKLTGAVTVNDVVTVTNTLGANENGVVIDLDAPLATVLHNWTAAQNITIDQTSAISGAWNATGRIMGVRSLVAFNNNITNVFGVYSKITAEAATASKTVNDVQAVVGVVDLLTTGGGTVTQQTTSMVCGLKGIITNTSTSCTWGGGCAVIAAEFGPNTTFTQGSALISAWNHGSTTVDQGLYLHPSGTLTVGIELDTAEGGTFGTGITIDACSTGIGINSESSILALKVVTGQDAAIIGRATVSSSITDAGLIRGIVGYVDVDTNATLDNGSIQIAGVHGQVIGVGTYTEVSSLSAVWADSQIAQTIDAGSLSLFRGTNNGATEITYMIDLWGTAEYFLRAEGVGGGTAWHSHAGTDAGGEAGFLLCLVGNQPRKIKLYAVA